ncbi:hypothetical protein MMC29_004331 [Sticta canariensis]|nr:hypothetical protein [Sticta canariensis]
MSPSIASSRVSPPCSTRSSILSFTNFFAPPPRSVSAAVELAVAQQQSRASHLSRSTPPPSLSKHVWLAPARGSGPHHGVGKPVQEAFNIFGSRLPRARPSHTGSKVKHSFTFNFGGYAVHAATLESMRKSFPSPLKNYSRTCTDVHRRPVAETGHQVDFEEIDFDNDRHQARLGLRGPDRFLRERPLQGFGRGLRRDLAFGPGPGMGHRQSPNQQIGSVRLAPSANKEARASSWRRHIEKSRVCGRPRFSEEDRLAVDCELGVMAGFQSCGEG